MKKPKRSDMKVITLQGKIIRYMRIARKISMREAGHFQSVPILASLTPEQASRNG